MFRRILSIYHNGGEYLSVNISSINEDDPAFNQTLAEAASLIKKPSTTKNIALQINDNSFGVSGISDIISWIANLAPLFRRFVIVGANRRDKRRLKKANRELNTACKLDFIYDWDAAKDWLVN